MNILYCGDDHVRDGVLLSVLSLTKQVEAPLHIYVFTAAISVAGTNYRPFPDAAINELRQVVKAHHAGGSVTRCDLTTLLTEMPPTANWQTRFTPYCMLRLYADLIPCMPDRLLYLDADVLAVADPRKFYDQPLTDTELVGVLDHYGQWYFHHGRRLRDYINSGVLLLNLKRIKQTGLFARCRERIAHRRMFMPDQSALNKLAQEKRLAPRKYNDQHGPHPDTVFLHFSTRLKFWPWFHPVTVKPWQVDSVQTMLGNPNTQTKAVYDDYATVRNARKG